MAKSIILIGILCLVLIIIAGYFWYLISNHPLPAYGIRLSNIPDSSNYNVAQSFTAASTACGNSTQYETVIFNKTPITLPNTVIQATSLILKCASVSAALQAYNQLNASGFPGVTSFPLSTIGNVTKGNIDVSDPNRTTVGVQFLYKNFYVSVHTIYLPGSTSTNTTISLAQEVLEQIKNSS